MKKIEVTAIPKPGPIVPEEALPAPQPRPSKYSEVIAALKALAPGQGFIIELPAGTSYRTFYNRLTSVLSRVRPPAGCRFVRRPQTGDAITGVVVTLRRK